MKSTATGLEPKTTQFLNKLSGCEFESSCSHLNFLSSSLTFRQLCTRIYNEIDNLFQTDPRSSKKNIIYIYDVTIIDDKVIQ